MLFKLNKKKLVKWAIRILILKLHEMEEREK